MQPPRASTGELGRTVLPSLGDVAPLDLSGFAAELGALLGFYAGRIEAAKRGASPADIMAAIRAIKDECTIAMRNLTQRPPAASQHKGSSPRASQIL